MLRHDGGAGPETSGCGCSGSATSRSGCGCGSCEGLQCLCRPRFFDGQLITAADFTRLDRYRVAKDRMHNRYLHGVGVVCGLEVVCDPCDDTVTVRSGYALGPCGEDIVVCHDARVDVGALVTQNRRVRARPDCPPYGDPPKDCEAARQQWVLGICYDERPARSVASLRRRESACGCGAEPSRGTPTSCEPTSICEGYRFTLTKVPPRSKNDRSRQGEGELPERVRRCLEVLRDGLTGLPSDPDPGELVTYCCDLQRDLRELVDSGSVHDCTLGQRLNEIVCPDPQDQQVVEKASAAIAAMLRIAVDLFRSCVCSALLPPCDTGAGEECVPLAVVTVRSSDLRVLDICNWSARKLVLTAPSLSYWFGWLPVFDGLRDLVERLCCGPGRRTFTVDRRLRVSELSQVSAVGAADGSTKAGESRPRPEEVTSMLDLAAKYLRTPSSLAGVDAAVLGSLGGLDQHDEPLASDLELAHPLAALALARGAEATTALLPRDVLDRLRKSERDGDREKDKGGGTNGPDDDRLARLEKALSSLKRTVDSQAKTIRTLKQKGPG